jgi:hypothetical protein
MADLVSAGRERRLAVGLLGGTSQTVYVVHYPSDVEAGQRHGEAAALKILNSRQWKYFKQISAVQ